MPTTTGTRRTAEVTWHGDLTEGRGTIESVGSGAFGPLDVTWRARAEEPEGMTSPEELIAAAHAACFSMAFASGLAKAGFTAEHLSSTATVTFVPGTGITTVALDVEGNVPGIAADRFRELGEQAKDGCPVSGAMKGNVDITVNVRLLETSPR